MAIKGKKIKIHHDWLKHFLVSTFWKYDLMLKRLLCVSRQLNLKDWGVYINTAACSKLGTQGCHQYKEVSFAQIRRIQ